MFLQVSASDGNENAVSHTPDEFDDVGQQLEANGRRAEELFLQCKLRSALQVAKETTRQARAQQRIINYMLGLFDFMRFGHGLLNPQITRDAAVELVVLLQDEEQARRIQPDLDEAHYHWVCAWMSSCAYDNLAEATGTMSGFNSDGMQACISEGIQVCRQTGKTECIRCFREYAADVYLAGDDLAMVRHQCQTLLEVSQADEDRDRRWSAAQRLGWLNALEGRLLQSEHDFESSLEFSRAEKVYLKNRATALVTADLLTIQMLQGRQVELHSPLFPELEAGEWPRLELEQAKLQALFHVQAAEFERAAEILTTWDRRLTEMKCLKEWFEVRLRLIAVMRLSDQESRAVSLGKGLEAKATEAQDYLTLRRWKRLMHPECAVSPVPLLGEPDAGPYRLGGEQSAERSALQDSPPEDLELADTAEEEVIAEDTPLTETLSNYMKRIMATQEDDGARHEILEELLSHEPEDIQDAGDAAYLVHLSRYVIQGREDAERIWPWADSIRRHFMEDATVVNVVAALGHYFRAADHELFDGLIPLEQLDKWFRLSLTMNPNHPRNHARAGAFFLDEELPGDAERAFSRAFRLDRTDGTVAHQLADLYRDTDRPRDALAVLDICLRKGSKDANVAWEAAMTALQLEQYDMLLTYLDRHRMLVEREQAWMHYYRGLALYRLGKFADSLRELDEELRFNPPGTLHLHAIRVCIHTAQGDLESAGEELRQLLDLQFSEVDYLSLHGLVRLAEALCDAVVGWPLNHPLRKRLVRRLLRAGLLADSFLEMLRAETPESNQVRFFRVQVRQPLDEDWENSEGCLAGQENWKDYLIDWGVLAEDEQDAVTRVLQLQNQCESAPAKMVQVEGPEETFRDRPGVLWQGYRRNEDREQEAH